ncbi:MAG TPA: lytic transglycosylase domain-containing protein, partial [Geobacterales bacterium]|nr:lytic transglycosylase domain-containing protein [Geobacterales bacterium]
PPIATLADRELAGFFPKTDKGERILALAAAGLSLDARNELAALRGQSDTAVTSSELTRLALEIGDYRSALRLNPRQGVQSITEANLALWGVNYPRPYWDEVRENARTTGLPPEFILSVIRAESTFDPDVESPAGAIGLMQLMPATARILLGKEDHRPLETLLRTPDLNIRLGSRHLRDLVASYRGNLIHATAAYNGGSGNVDRWLSRFGSLADDELVEAIPFNETREYVKKVLTAKALYRILYQPTAVAEIDTAPLQ